MKSKVLHFRKEKKWKKGMAIALAIGENKYAGARKVASGLRWK